MPPKKKKRQPKPKFNFEPFAMKLMDMVHSFVANDLVALTGAALITVPIEDWANERAARTGEHTGTGAVISSIRSALVIAIGVRAAAPAIPAIAELATRASIGAGQKPGLVETAATQFPWMPG